MKAITEIVLAMLFLVVVSPVGVSIGVVDFDGGYALAGDTHIWHIETVDSLGVVGQCSSLALDSSDNPHISYRDAQPNYNLKYAYYDGTSWNTETVDTDGGLDTSIALDSSDNPHISYKGFNGLKYAYYDGTSWNTETVDSENVGESTSIALDSSDNPHISYFDIGNNDTKYAYYDGTSWNTETVDSEDFVGWFTSIALDSSDNPHISYWDFTNDDLKYAYYNGTDWNIETVDSEGGVVGVHTSIALDSNDNSHISYYGNGDLKYAYYNGTDWNIETVDSEGYVGWFTSIALDISDNPHISYYDDSNDDLKYAYYGGSWHIETVDSAGDVGWGTSLALDSNDNPHISYYDDTNGDLKYAYAITAYSLTITTTTGGTTIPSPGTHTYSKGISANVTAIPDTNYVFDHWELDGSWNYSNPISVTMDSNHTLHAVFTYVVTIEAYCYNESAYVSVNITMDGSPTGNITPHTFTGLTGTHTFTVPSTDPNEHPFKQWNTSETSTTITVTTGGTYTAYYQAKYNLTITATKGGTTNPSLGTHSYWDGASVSVTAIPDTNYVFDHWELDGSWNYSNPISVIMDSDHTLHAVFTYYVTIKAYCYNESAYVSVGITMDGTPTGFNTSYTFTDLNGTHTFTIPSNDSNGHPFKQWSTGETSTTITVTTSGTYTAYYGASHHDVAVTNVTLSKTVLGQGYCMNITVTVENQGNLSETFHSITHYDELAIPTLEQWNVFWRLGDVNGDGYIDPTDYDLIQDALWSYPGDPNYNPYADLNQDGEIDSDDKIICVVHYGYDIWTYFGLGTPPIGMRAQRVVELYPNNQTTLTFTWNTTGVPYGNYTINATATPVPGETDTDDNTYTDDWVVVTIPGDVDGNGEVDTGDKIKLANALWSYPGEPRYNPNADVNCDGEIDTGDKIVIGNHLWETWP